MCTVWCVIRRPMPIRRPSAARRWLWPSVRFSSASSWRSSFGLRPWVTRLRRLRRQGRESCRTAFRRWPEGRRRSGNRARWEPHESNRQKTISLRVGELWVKSHNYNWSHYQSSGRGFWSSCSSRPPLFESRGLSPSYSGCFRSPLSPCRSWHHCPPLKKRSTSPVSRHRPTSRQSDRRYSSAKASVRCAIPSVPANQPVARIWRGSAPNWAGTSSMRV